ncbi:MAG: PAS domain S-box protein [Gammaproteobacteria bacterium]|nr:PAS domain S-box protein [Gammaproteobacteria bacterium]
MTGDPANAAAPRSGLRWWYLIFPALVIVLWGDTFTQHGFAHGTLYAPLVLFAFWSRRWQFVAAVAALGSAFTILGYYISPPAPAGFDNAYVLANRTVSIAVILAAFAVCAILLRTVGRLARANDDLLAARETLQNSYRLLEVAGEAGQLGGWSVHLADNRVSWSDGLYEMFGLANDQALDLTVINDLITPEHRRRMARSFERCSKDGAPFDEEVEVERPDGSRMWLRSIGRAVRDEDGRIVMAQGAMQDITRLKTAELSVVESQHRLRTLADALPVFVWSTGPDGRVTYFSRPVQEYTGLSHEELAADDGWLSLVHPDDRDTTAAAWAEARRSGRPYSAEFRLRSAAGDYQWFYASAKPIFDDDGVLSMWYGSAINVHRLKQVELGHRELTERLTVTFESIADPFFTLDADWRITYVNSHAEQLVGKSREAVIGRRLQDEYPLITDAEFGRRLQEAAQSRKRAHFQIYADSLERWLDTSVYPAPDGGLAIHLRDVTERKRLEDQLQQAQRLDSIGQLTGGVAHDFNNLLTVILGNADLLREALDHESRLRPLAEMIGTAAESGANLTQRLLAFARRQMLEPRPVDVNQQVAGMDEMLRRTLGEHIELETVCAAGLWQALVDPAQLENALLNLCLNARDAMPDGGCLTIETANVTIDDDYVQKHAEAEPGQYVMLAVSDTGAGISTDHQQHIFEPFFSTKNKDQGKGTGLGLAMVYGFIRQSRGLITVYSEPGQGTTFKVYLPRALEPAAQPAPEPSGSSRGGTERILVVEDDELVRRFACQQLEDLGYRVVEAENGQEALRKLEEHTDVALLFTDVVMPGGMNGRQLAEAVAAVRPEVRVLFTSGYTENAIIHHGRLDPGVNLLAKPYRREELARRVREILDD